MMLAYGGYIYVMKRNNERRCRPPAAPTRAAAPSR